MDEEGKLVALLASMYTKVVWCATITGVSSAYAQSLKRVMESHAHVQNLYAMRTALAMYLGPEYYEDVD